MDKLSELADRIEASANAQLDEIVAMLDRMNENSRQNPGDCGLGMYWAVAGGMFACAAALRARIKDQSHGG